MNMKFCVLFLMAGGMLVLGAGCATRPSLPVYDSSQVGNPITAQHGEIVSVRDVVIKAPSQSAGGTGMGARIGSAAGRSAIYGGPSAITGAVGAVVGEAVGAAVGAKTDDKLGEEITVLVEGGQTVTIVQERGDSPLAPGEHVKLVTGASSSVYGGGSTKTKVVRDEEAVGGGVSERVR